MMKALTLYEPWASLITLGEKKYETRSWVTSYRGPIAIHAAKKMPGNIIFQEPFYTALSKQHCGGDGVEFPGPCIIAICNLVDCVEIESLGKIDGVPVFANLENGQEVTGNELAFGDYTPGRFAWKLEDVHRLKTPIPAKGRQRIWNWDETEHEIAIDPYSIGDTKIWTPKGILSGRKLDRPDEDAVRGLEVD